MTMVKIFANNEAEIMAENRRLREEITALRRENAELRRLAPAPIEPRSRVTDELARAGLPARGTAADELRARAGLPPRGTAPRGTVSLSSVLSRLAPPPPPPAARTTAPAPAPPPPPAVEERELDLDSSSLRFTLLELD